MRLRIKDNGAAIPAQYHERIFEPFVRLAHNEQNGTGMGLAIVRKAMQRMNGGVSVLSEAGRGNTFTLELPAAS